MRTELGPSEVLVAWSRIPNRIRNSIRGLNETDLDLRGGSEGWSIRETVHHVVEANLVASNMIIAALATNGCNFDWTWVNPDKAWMRRVGYDRADVRVAIKALAAVCRHVSGLVAAKPGGFDRTVKLNDAPGAKRYVLTVEEILRQETGHAEEHLSDVGVTRRFHSQ